MQNVVPGYLSICRRDLHQDRIGPNPTPVALTADRRRITREEDAVLAALESPDLVRFREDNIHYAGE